MRDGGCFGWQWFVSTQRALLFSPAAPLCDFRTSLPGLLACFLLLVCFFFIRLFSSSSFFFTAPRPDKSKHPKSIVGRPPVFRPKKIFLTAFSTCSYQNDVTNSNNIETTSNNHENNIQHPTTTSHHLVYNY